MDLKHAFLKSAKDNGIQIATHLEAFHSPEEYLLELQRFGIKIIIAFVPSSEAVDILCTAPIISQSMAHYSHFLGGQRLGSKKFQVQIHNNSTIL